VANALSQKYEKDESLFSLSYSVPDWLQSVHQEWKQDTFVDECEVCQCNKGETIKNPSTLQLLPIPTAIW
jgi:hypothetical protein